MATEGKVKWFDTKKGFGFIENEEKDVFVHTSAVKEANLELNEGDAITFDITETPKGNSAINLRK